MTSDTVKVCTNVQKITVVSIYPRSTVHTTDRKNFVVNVHNKKKKKKKKKDSKSLSSYLYI